MLSKPESNGFTIVEVLVTMLFIGVIAILTIPGIVYKANDQDALFKSKNMAQQLQAVAVKHSQDNPSNPATSSKTIADLTNFTISDVTSPAGGAAGSLTTNGPACTAAAPCYKFADGGIMIPGAWASGKGNFFYDPDGADIRPGVTLVLDYNTSFVVPLGVTAGHTTAEDPDYIGPWNGSG